PHRFLFLGQGAAAASSGDEKPSRLVSVPAITPLSTRRELIMRVRASKRTVSMSRPPRRSEMSSFHCRERSDVAHGENCVFSRTNFAPTIEKAGGGHATPGCSTFVDVAPPLLRRHLV